MENVNYECIKRYLKNYFTQDNLGTRYPIYFVIRTYSWDRTDQACADQTMWVYEDILYTQEQYNKLEEDEKEYCEEIGVKRVFKDEGFFLTQREAELHLQRNNYHYSEDAHTYCKHVWRNHFFEDFLKSLCEYFEVEEGLKEL